MQFRIISSEMGGRYPKGSIHEFQARALRGLEESTGLRREELVCPLAVAESYLERRERLAKEKESRTFMSKLRELVGTGSTDSAE